VDVIIIGRYCSSRLSFESYRVIYTVELHFQLRTVDPRQIFLKGIDHHQQTSLS